jgi:uncharacterized protein HemX
MYRYLVGAIVVAIIAALIGWNWNRRQQAATQREQARIAELSDHARQLEQENGQLKAALAKVQAEEDRLVTENQILTKTLEQARLTGKVPSELPYPPK